MTQSNSPDLWRSFLPVPKPDGHKYDRGVAVIYGAPKMTGATRLAAEACARIGAGLVKVIAPDETGDIYRTALSPHIVVEDWNNDSPETPILDSRCRSVLMGPGCPPDKIYKQLFHKALRADHVQGTVLDAGAFAVWGGESMDELHAFSSDEKVVVTPHEGEFHRFFESYAEGPWILDVQDKEGRAQEAAQRINSIMLLKGATTVVATDQRTVTQKRVLPQLATAGTGDVLSGMITGLCAQGVPVFEASCAAVWIHAEAAERFGTGLVASDLPDMIPAILRDLQH